MRLRRLSLCRRAPAQASLELALSVPVLLAVLVLIVGAGRIVQAELGVQAVARETARLCATATSAEGCVEQGLARARLVAGGWGLDARSLEVRLDHGGFARGGTAVARARYPLRLLGSVAGLGPVVTAEAAHAEPIERFRSRAGGA